MPLLWSPAVLQHFASSFWMYVVTGLDWEKVERWVVGQMKKNSYWMTLRGAQSVKNMRYKDPWMSAVDGGAIFTFTSNG